VRLRPHPGPAVVRPATGGEVDVAVDLLSRAAFGPTVGRLVEFPRASPHGCVLVAEWRGAIRGAACCLSLGATGWIGALGVAPEARRRGLGTDLTTACVEWLRGRGAETVLLFATDLGRPVYERIGFVAEGCATAWRGVAGAPPPPPPELRTLRDEDRAAVRALDRAATGERRDTVLDALRPLSGMAAERDGQLVGSAIASVWGAGVAITASDPEAGERLLASATRGPGGGTVIIPDANAAAADALRRWSFARLNDGERMRLGPQLAWRPDWQWGLFNLFWG
jgi:predicted N-acetyltransferase YhbS